MAFAIVWTFFLVATYGCLSVDASTEPQCLLRFDHDFKMLKKLAEHEQAQEEFAASLDEMKKQLADLKNEGLLSKDTRCPNGWTRYDQSCYRFFDELELSWNDAAEHCDSLCGAHLVAMETNREQMFLTQTVQKLKKAAGSSKFFWTGATDLSQEGTWVWHPSGTPLSAGDAHWAQGQPGGGAPQDCGLMWGDDDYALHDHTCKTTGYFICEKRPGQAGY